MLKERRAPGPRADASAMAAYAEALRQAKIVVIASERSYFVHEFSDSMLSGALVVSDPPTDFTEEFGRVAVPIDSDDHSRVVERVMWWLRHDTERVARTRAARRWAMEELTTDRWLELMTESYFVRAQHCSLQLSPAPPPHQSACLLLCCARLCQSGAVGAGDTEPASWRGPCRKEVHGAVRSRVPERAWQKTEWLVQRRTAQVRSSAAEAFWRLATVRARNAFVVLPFTVWMRWAQARATRLQSRLEFHLLSSRPVTTRLQL